MDPPRMTVPRGASGVRLGTSACLKPVVNPAIDNAVRIAPVINDKSTRDSARTAKIVLKRRAATAILSRAPDESSLPAKRTPWSEAASGASR